MTVQHSPAVRNARADAKESAMGTAIKVQLWTGGQPTNTAAAATGTKLAEWSLASDYSPAASGGVKSFSSTPIAATGLAGGTAGHYRLVDAAGTTCHEQGSVTATGGGGDATIDNPVVALGQAVNITGWQWTEPGA